MDRRGLGYESSETFTEGLVGGLLALLIPGRGRWGAAAPGDELVPQPEVA